MADFPTFGLTDLPDEKLYVGGNRNAEIDRLTIENHRLTKRVRELEEIIEVETRNRDRIGYQ